MVKKEASIFDQAPLRGAQTYRRIGLTGAIASGKSSVAKILKEAGYLVLDADLTYHKLIQKPEVVKKLARLLGPQILGGDGGLDRAKMAQLVFSDPQKKKALEAYTHPLIYQDLLDQERAIQDYSKKLLFFDIPLLAETYAHAKGLKLDGVWLVVTEDGLRKKRLMRRNQLSPAQAQERMDAQADATSRAKIASRILTNNLGWKELKASVLEAIACEEKE